MAKQGVTVLFDQQATTATSNPTDFIEGDFVVHAFVAGTGAVTATVLWYGNTDKTNTNGVLIATSTLSGTTSDSTGAEIVCNWPYIYAVLSAISGTSAKVTARVSA